MIFLITAAGAGSRFKSQGINIPKPLIRVNGETLLEHTLKSFRFKKNDHLIIASQKSHRLEQELNKSFHDLYGQVILHWFDVNRLLPGQLATSYHTLSNLIKKYPELNSLPLWIHNCDTGFISATSYQELKAASMPVFKAKGTHWSFGSPHPDDSNRAICIAEKVRISNLASIGLYGFSTTQRFLQTAYLHLKDSQPLNGEYYIAPMLQSIIEKDELVCMPRVEGIKLYGTPQELCKTFNISMEDLAKENQ